MKGFNYAIAAALLAERATAEKWSAEKYRAAIAELNREYSRQSGRAK